MKFIILGTGGVGGFFGAKLANAGEEVWFIARGEHLQTMKTSGLHVRWTQGEMHVPPGRMTDNVGEAGKADVVLFCVKSYDTEAAAEQLKRGLTESSIIIPLQNGVDNAEKIRRIIPTGTVYGGVAYVSSRISGPGEITEAGGIQRILFGPLDGSASGRANEVLSALLKAGIQAALKPDIIKDIWRKFVFITSMGSFTALSRLNHGEILESEESQALILEAMHEVEAIGRAKGVELEPATTQKVRDGLMAYKPDIRSSMYYDLINGRPMEIEALNGTVVRLGKELGIPTPIHRTIYAALLPHHREHLQAKASQQHASHTAPR